MSDPTSEFSESGAPIYRHKPREKPFEIAFGEVAHIQLIEGHISRHIGVPGTVFHEVISDLVHIDVHIVSPSPTRNFYTLITSGMSARAMAVPPGHEDFSYAELMLSLPPDWSLKRENLKDERNYWPLRLLRILARMPHAYNTWFGNGHTIPIGDPPKPLATNTDFCGVMISEAKLVPPSFQSLAVSPEMKIHFYAVIPLYKEEMDMKLKKGAEDLLDRFKRYQVTELVDVKRRNVSKKFLGLF
jgi:hypothetical protein